MAAAIGQFGLQDAGRAGAEKDAHPLPSMAGNGLADLRGEVVGFEGHLGQAVVAAIVGGKRGGQALVVDAGHFADPGGELDRLEGARRQSAAPFAQG